MIWRRRPNFKPHDDDDDDDDEEEEEEEEEEEREEEEEEEREEEGREGGGEKGEEKYALSGGKCVPKIRCGLIPPYSGSAAEKEQATHSFSLTRLQVDITQRPTFRTLRPSVQRMADPASLPTRPQATVASS